VFHLAEGCDPLGYLSGPKERIARGVSATFVVQPSGRVVQMLALDHVSGSLNPREVRTSTDPDGWAGRRYTRFMDRDILDGWVNHRAWSIECAGFALRDWTCGDDIFQKGPNERQVEAVVELVGLLRERAKRPLGFTIHRDFADYKPCPGRSDGVKALLERLGHGEEPVVEEPSCQEQLADAQATVQRLRTRLVAKEDALESLRTELAAAEDGIDAALVRARRIVHDLAPLGTDQA
jgi:hypothetical protein